MEVKKTSQTQKRLAVFLDGTWNAVGDNTNVWRLRSLCLPKSDNGWAQLTYYDEGVNGFGGGTFGRGVIRNTTEAYEWLVENYSPGDEIFIFGFSRGAYTARSLAGLIAKYGLLRLGAPLGVRQIYDRYRRQLDRTLRDLIKERDDGTLNDASLEEQWLMRFSLPVPIKFIGVWDTVGSHGVPLFSIEGISSSTLRFQNTGLFLCYENAVQALAIDEHRAAFPPTIWTVKNTTAAKPRSVDSVEQRWFVGAHGNVGGGYDSDLLSQQPLKWIMSRAERVGLSFRPDLLVDQGSNAATVADSYAEFLWGVYRGFSWRKHREIGQKGLLVEGVPSTTVNESIDSRVFERWREDNLYRPPSLAKWAKAYGVDIKSITRSIRTDNPSITVPD